MGWLRHAIRAAAMVLAVGIGAPAAAQTPVDLQLVLAVDVSGSVNQTRFELQRDGYVAAFGNPRVLDTIRSGPHQAIAVTMVQWTGPALQVHVVPWMRIGDVASADAFAAAVARTPRQLFGGGTSISGVIDYAVTLMPESPYRGTRRVIDISGDGSNNRGRLVNLARDEAVAANIGKRGKSRGGQEVAQRCLTSVGKYGMSGWFGTWRRDPR
jgi:uncharacterized protein DUF1194